MNAISLFSATAKGVVLLPFLLIRSGNTHGRGRINTIDLRLVNSSDHLLLALKKIFFFYETSYSIKEVNHSEPRLSCKGSLIK
jgi:hypothetical protein